MGLHNRVSSAKHQARYCWILFRQEDLANITCLPCMNIEYYNLECSVPILPMSFTCVNIYTVRKKVWPLHLQIIENNYKMLIVKAVAD